MRYLTYRESRDEKARQVSGKERWTDRGMGGSVAEIIRQCDHLQSDHVLLFSLVINPNPDLVAMIPHEERERFVCDLTEKVIDAFFEERGIDTGIEMSYVTHHRLSEDLQNPGLHNPHTHAVLPGTVYDEEAGNRVPLYISRNQQVNHIEMLHRVTEQQAAELLDQYIGLDWEQRMDGILVIREGQRQVTRDQPDAVIRESDEQRWGVWCGVRRETEQTTAFGYYREVPAPTDGDPNASRIEFRPLISNLDHEQAEQQMNRFHRNREAFQRLVESKSGMRVSSYEPVIEEQHQSLTLDIDF